MKVLGGLLAATALVGADFASGRCFFRDGEIDREIVQKLRDARGVDRDTCRGMVMAAGWEDLDTPFTEDQCKCLANVPEEMLWDKNCFLDGEDSGPTLYDRYEDCNRWRSFVMTKEFEVIANPLDDGENFYWLESPLWVPSHNMLLFTDVKGEPIEGITSGIIYQYKEGEGVSVFLRHAGFVGPNRERMIQSSHLLEGGSNGMILNPRRAGEIIMAQHGMRRVVSFNIKDVVDGDIDDDKVNVICSQYYGFNFNSPNDMQFYKGDLYITDPPFGLQHRGDEGGEMFGRMEQPGFSIVRVFEGNGECTRFMQIGGTDEPFAAPNGITFTDAGMFVAMTSPGDPHFRLYKENDRGVFTSEYTKIPALYSIDQEENPIDFKLNDGVTRIGNHVIATGPGGIYIVDTANKGRVDAYLRIDDLVSNVDVGGGYLWVTANHRVVRYPLTGGKWSDYVTRPEYEVVAEGKTDEDQMYWLESPLWNDEGEDGYLLFTDVKGEDSEKVTSGKIYKWQEYRGVEVFLEDAGMVGPGKRANQEDIPKLLEGGSNGMIWGEQPGQIIMAQHGMNRVVTFNVNDVVNKRINPKKVKVLADEWDGRPLNSPNDFAKWNGRIYFTDPPFGRQWKDGSDMFARAKRLAQSQFNIYSVDVGKKVTKKTRDTLKVAMNIGSADDFIAPNGIAITPHGMMVAITNGDDPHFRFYKRKGKTFVQKYQRLESRHRINTRRTPIDFPLNDGLTAKGSVVFAAGPGGVYIFDTARIEEGEQAHLRIDDLTSNVEIGGKHLYVTANRRVLRYPLTPKLARSRRHIFTSYAKFAVDYYMDACAGAQNKRECKAHNCESSGPRNCVTKSKEDLTCKGFKVVEACNMVPGCDAKTRGNKIRCVGRPSWEG